MKKIELETVQWTSLPDVDRVEPISDRDFKVLAEVGRVLAKHGYTRRFGICLLHKHFDLADGEVLLETTDTEARVSTLAVERQDAPSMGIETMWRFSEGAEPVIAAKCVTRCDASGGRHRRVHSHVPVNM
jgi:hypothetical protein